MEMQTDRQREDIELVNREREDGKEIRTCIHKETVRQTDPTTQTEEKYACKQTGRHASKETWWKATNSHTHKHAHTHTHARRASKLTNLQYLSLSVTSNIHTLSEYTRAHTLSPCLSLYYSTLQCNRSNKQTNRVWDTRNLGCPEKYRNGKQDLCKNLEEERKMDK